MKWQGSMMKCRCLLVGLCFLSLTLLAQMRELSFYEVRHRTAPIVIDGIVSENEWKDIPVHDSYFEYWKANPGPGALKTELRLAYDKDGLYMAVVNHEDVIDKLKRTITEKDDENLWTNDCGEFYFDPAANGIGYTKFVINANGTGYDMRRQDASVFLFGWNGTGWKSAATVGKDAWYIEAFFPWDDLNGTGVPGALWQFCHTRFSWTKGFRGMVNSPGANYNATNNFGYIYFSDGKTAFDPVKIGNILVKKAAAPWCIPCGRVLISCNGSRVRSDDLSDLLTEEKERCRYLFMEMAALQPPPEMKGKINKIRDSLIDAEKKNIMSAYKMYQSAVEKLFLLKWNLLIDRNFK